MNRTKQIVEKLLQLAGIQINGHNPWDIQVHDERLYARVLAQGSLGLGEAYLDGWWDVQQLDEFFNRILQARLDKKVRGDWKIILQVVLASLGNLQNKKRAYDIGKHHYDLGNVLYEAMLDERLVYTCGYWKKAKTLAEAQEEKLDLVCKKLNLQAGQTVLDIGCGWGSFAKFASQKYGAHVVGVTVSQEQIELGKKNCAGLPVELRYQDYRDIKNEKFDHIVSLGMFEHVGYKNYRTYMEIARRVLKDSGLFLLHTIGGLHSVKTTDPWIAKYIFPNSMLPSLKQLSVAIEGLFVMEDWHSFGADYDKTLMMWFQNFDQHWQKLKHQYSDRFYRMWKYYLLCCAGSFRARKNQLWQIVLSKNGVVGGYPSVR